jgi:hypothetical protein
MSGTNHLRDLKAGDVIVVGTGKRATAVTVDSVGRNYLYAGTGVYRRDNGRQKTGNGIARTVLGWRTEMQAAAARSALSAVYIDVGYNVSAADVLRAYHALRREFSMRDLPALESFALPTGE